MVRIVWSLADRTFQLWYRVFGVADGHGGDAAAELAAGKFAEVFDDVLVNAEYKVCAGLSAAFNALEEEVLQACPREAGACLAVCVVAGVGYASSSSFTWFGPKRRAKYSRSSALVRR